MNAARVASTAGGSGGAGGISGARRASLMQHGGDMLPIARIQVGSRCYK